MISAGVGGDRNRGVETVDGVSTLTDGDIVSCGSGKANPTGGVTRIIGKDEGHAGSCTHIRVRFAGSDVHPATKNMSP